MTVLTETNLIIYALDHYLYKGSANKTMFLADLRLILSILTYYNKYIERNPILVYNRITVIINLFGRETVIEILKFVLDDKYELLSKIIKNV